MDVYLGVDGGNSGTRALLVDAHAVVLGYGTSGGSNHQGQGLDSALRNVAAAVEAALDCANATLDQVRAAYFALAGDDTNSDSQALTAGLSASWPRLRFSLGNDVWDVLLAGAVGGHGIAVNCGSGAGAVGRNETGRGLIIPDLGYVFGDSGGGGQIAIDAFRAVFRAADGRGEPTTLTSLILDATGRRSVDELRLAVYHDQIPPAMKRVAVRLVFKAAAAEDQVATCILRHIGQELGVSGAAVARRLGMQHSAFSFVLTGGVFRTLDSPLAAAAIARLRQEAPLCVPTLPLVQPAAGAALLALDDAGQEVIRQHYAHLEEQGYGWYPEETFA